MIISDVINELVEYATLEGSEIGETCVHLMNLWNMRTYLSNDLQELLDKEIRWNLDNFKKNYEILKETKTYTSKYLEYHEGSE